MEVSKLIFLILFLLPPISALQNITLSSSLVSNVDNSPSRTSPSDNPCYAPASETSKGICGYNSICALENGGLKCKCPPGYSFINQKNKFGGCKSNIPLDCKADDASELYEIYELQGVNFPFGDYEKLENYNKEVCKDSCLRDCFCAAAIFGESTTCWKKRAPLSNGRTDESDTSIALIKVRKAAPLKKQNIGNPA